MFAFLGPLIASSVVQAILFLIVRIAAAAGIAFGVIEGLGPFFDDLMQDAIAQFGGIPAQALSLAGLFRLDECAAIIATAAVTSVAIKVSTGLVKAA